MPGVSAKLNLTYVINNEGAIKVTQKWQRTKGQSLQYVPFRYANANAA